MDPRKFDILQNICTIIFLSISICSFFVYSAYHFSFQFSPVLIILLVSSFIFSVISFIYTIQFYQTFHQNVRYNLQQSHRRDY